MKFVILISKTSLKYQEIIFFVAIIIIKKLAASLNVFQALLSYFGVFRKIDKWKFKGASEVLSMLKFVVRMVKTLTRKLISAFL